MPVSEAVLALLATTIDSFEKLEVAHALRDGAPHPVDALRAALGHPRDELAAALAGLAASDLVSVRDGVATLAAPDDAAFAELMAAYEQDRFAVAAALSKVSLERARTMTARAFANAFIVTKRRRGDHDG